MDEKFWFLYEIKLQGLELSVALGWVWYMPGLVQLGKTPAQFDECNCF